MGIGIGLDARKGDSQGEL
jgi:hypothetical protein